MATVNMNKDNFAEIVDKNEMVLIDFWAGWCGPCRMFGPIFEKTSEKYPDVVFAKCDTENSQEVAAMFGVRAIPTLAVFRDQILLFLQSGVLPEDALSELIERVKGLDMDDVRKKIAEEQARQKADAEAGGKGAEQSAGNGGSAGGTGREEPGN